MNQIVRIAATGFCAVAFLFLLPVSFAHAGESCGSATCTDSQVCCDAFVGTGPQCVAGSRCPANTHPLHPTATNPAPATQPAAAQPSRPAAQASNPPSGGGATLENPLRAGSLPELLTIVLKAVVQIGSILLVLALVWVGFLFVMAQGAEEKIRDARGALVWTVIGGMLLLGAKAISEVIQATVQTL